MIRFFFFAMFAFGSSVTFSSTPPALSSAPLGTIEEASTEDQLKVLLSTLWKLPNARRARVVSILAQTDRPLAERLEDAQALLHSFAPPSTPIPSTNSEDSDDEDEYADYYSCASSEEFHTQNSYIP